MWHRPILTLMVAATVVAGCETETAVDEEPVAEDTVATDAAAVEDSIRAVNARFETAVLAGDTVALADLYTEDAVVLAPGAPRMEGRASIRTALGNMTTGMQEFELTTDRVEVAESGDMAWELGSYALTVQTPDGQTIQDRGKYVVVWENVDGGWRLVADAFNSDLPPGDMAPAEPADATAAEPDTTA